MIASNHGPSIIDAAIHVGSPDIARYPRSADFPNAPQFSAPIQEFEDTASLCGVSGAVVVQPSQYGFDHSYLSACLKGREDRYAGVALLDPTDGCSPAYLEALYADRGVRGLRLGPNYGDGRAWLSAPATLIELATELRMVVSIFMAPPHLGAVEEWLERYPTTNAVIDHLGRPDLDEAAPSRFVRALGRLARFPFLYLKVSALPALSRKPFPHRDTWEWVKMVYDCFGAERLMWGSDFPLTARGAAYRRGLDTLMLATNWLEGRDLDSLVGGTARSLYKLPAGGSTSAL